MKSNALVILAANLLVCSSEHGPSPPTPFLHQNSHLTGSAQPPSPPPPDCSNVRCPGGRICRMIEEQCDHPQCPGPLPECVRDGPEPPPSPTLKQRSPTTRLSSTRNTITTTQSPSTAQKFISHRPAHPPSTTFQPQTFSKRSWSPKNAITPTQISSTTQKLIPQVTSTEADLPFKSCSEVTCPEGTICRIVNVQNCRAPGCPRSQPKCINKAPAQLRCPKNESWRSCASRCEPSCENMVPKCTKDCDRPKCQCAPGFLRHRSGKCVARSSC